MNEDTCSCPQLDALVKRHNDLRRSRDLGRRLAEQSALALKARLDAFSGDKEALLAALNEHFARQAKRDREREEKWRNRPPSDPDKFIDAEVFNRRIEISWPEGH